MVDLTANRARQIVKDLPAEVPIFPLPNHVFFPGLPAPYRIFEPRYKQMVEDLLELDPDDRWIGMTRLEDGWEPEFEGQPEFERIGTVGRVFQISSIDRGHYLIVVRGEERCVLTELVSNRDYRQAAVELLPDEPTLATAEQIETKLNSLLELTSAAAQLVQREDADEVVDLFAGDDASAEEVSFRLGAALLVDPDARQAFLDERRLWKRLEILESRLTDALDQIGGGTA